MESAEAPALRAVIRLQETIHGCLRGRHPEPYWLGSVSGIRFLQVIFELIEILTHPTAERRFILADMLVPDEFRRAYNVGGRFEHLQFSTLPWFARFLVLAALDRLLQAFPAGPVQTSSALAITVHHLLSRFLRSLQFDQRAAILKRTKPWPSSLRIAFQQAATIARQPSSLSPEVKYNGRSAPGRRSTGYVQGMYVVRPDSRG